MGLEDSHPDILQNIEFMIVRIYKENGELRDKNVMKGLEALKKHYHALVTRKNPVDPSLKGLELDIYKEVMFILEKRRTPTKEEDQPRRFSRAFKVPTQDEIFLACLGKIEKSVKFWNKERGERGYLDFVKHYIL
ncbi:MAG: hypothetical protein R2828_15490 [Saprospiraceae bacterium]